MSDHDNWLFPIGIVALICALIFGASEFLDQARSVGNQVQRTILAGQWEGEGTRLFLYPTGDAILNGHRGTWSSATFEGTVVFIELPRRQQTDGCHLSLTDRKALTISGSLFCAGRPIVVERTEPFGAISEALEISKRKKYIEKWEMARALEGEENPAQRAWIRVKLSFKHEWTPWRTGHNLPPIRDNPAETVEEPGNESRAAEVGQEPPTE